MQTPSTVIPCSFDSKANTDEIWQIIKEANIDLLILWYLRDLININIIIISIKAKSLKIIKLGVKDIHFK